MVAKTVVRGKRRCRWGSDRRECEPGDHEDARINGERDFESVAACLPVEEGGWEVCSGECFSVCSMGTHSSQLRGKYFQTAKETGSE